MKKAFAILLLPLVGFAQGMEGPHDAALRDAGFGFVPAAPEDHISAEDRARIWRALDRQLARLNLAKSGERPRFIWPFRVARGFSQPGADAVSNLVDHDPAYPDRLRDYNCGARTYDLSTGYNHQGIDISIWPDGWNMMDTGELEIVAAAAGTIVHKSDGHFDRNCSMAHDSDWNAVYVQHDDGSIAWYGHLKMGSLTDKPIGARVAAGEFLGHVGSSGRSTRPHLHFEVYDASRRLVDPYRGTCNVMNAETWWARQPDYLATRVNRVITASAPPVFSTCGSDGRMQSPGDLNEKADFAPGEAAYFVAFVRDIPAGQAVVFTVRRPDGSVWRTVSTTPVERFYPMAYWYASYTLPSGEPEGTWTFEARIGESGSAVPFTLTAAGQGIPNYTDLWWNPDEPGWGVNLNHQGGTLFATWFTYDTDGNGMWLVMPDAAGGPTQMSGTIYRATGVPLHEINAAPAAHFPLARAGSATFTFLDRHRATFTYTLGGETRTKSLQRQSFSTPTSCVESRASRIHATNYQDLWWNPEEPGWGINLAHQGDVIFATWFTYGAGGRGQWLVGSQLRRQPTGEFHGLLYRATGRPHHEIDGAPALASLVQVGELTLSFPDGERGRMDYLVDGIAQSKSLVRQVFGSTRPLCK